MLLNEILKKPISNLRTATKAKNVDELHHSINRRTTQKMSHIGSGIFANAYEHLPSNTVLKNVDITGGVEDATYQFLRLVKRNQNNPYFPKILKVKAYKTKEGEPDINRLLITMERLYNLEPSDILDLAKLLGLDLTEYVSLDNPRADRIIGDVIYGMFDNPMQRSTMIKHAKDPNLRKALRMLEPIFHHYGPDMHMGNIMKRASGHIVITDPVV